LISCSLAQKGDLRGAEFPAHSDDALADGFVRDAETRGDGFVGMALREFAVDFALAWREMSFGGGGGLRGLWSLEGFGQERGNDAVLAICFSSGGEKHDEAQFCFACGWQGIRCDFRRFQ